MRGAWRGDVDAADQSGKGTVRCRTVAEAGGAGDGLVVRLVPADLVEMGDVEAVDAGGVGIDEGLRRFVEEAEAVDLPPRAAAAWGGGLEEEDDDGEASVIPHEARTLFSTLTVSSRNINDSWSR